MAPNRRIILGELPPNKPSAQQPALTKTAPRDAATGVPDPVNFKAVIAKCKELDSKYKGACKLLEEHRLSLRKRAKVIERWARHSDALQREIEQLRAKLQSRPSSRDGALIAQADKAGVVTRADDDSVAGVGLKRPSPETASEYNPPSSPRPLVVVPGEISTPSPPRRILSEPPPRLPTEDTFRRTASPTTTGTSSSTTDDVELPAYSDPPVEALAAIKAELSSDPPIIISTRSVRKRKHGKDEPEITRTQKVKLEHSSSSGPEIIRESHQYSPAETIDFDEEIHVPTPKKRRVLPVSGLDKALTNSGTMPIPKFHVQGHIALEAAGALDKSPTLSHAIVGPKSHKPSMPRDTSPRPKWSGRAVVADGSVEPGVFTSHLALGIKDLAEDGDAEREDAVPVQIQRPVVKGRLDALLNSPSVKTGPQNISLEDPQQSQTSRPVTVHDSNNSTSFITASKHWRDSNSTPRDTKHLVPNQSAPFSPSPKQSVSRERAPKTASIVRGDMPRGRSLNKEEIPLRERPIEMLRPEDFKPNPLYNDGLTFVYDEVVRGKDARAALSGCIDPNCCGKTFRRFAEAELRSVGSSVTRRAEDVGLIETYLGDEAFKLGTMTREERVEAWLRAKTWELANKFGKHRQRYSRMQSPPGFWSMDFPNTQERAEELRQAEEIRKALVSERHREAMRCRGSWLFRDEEPR